MAKSRNFGNALSNFCKRALKTEPNGDFRHIGNRTTRITFVYDLLGGIPMSNRNNNIFGTFPEDQDEVAIQLLLTGLRGNTSAIDERMEANLTQCATMALFHGRRMNFATQEAFDALAAICLVLGGRRAEFFENVFMQRMMQNLNLTPREKLNRIIEVVVGTIPPPRVSGSNDNETRETA